MSRITSDARNRLPLPRLTLLACIAGVVLIGVAPVETVLAAGASAPAPAEADAAAAAAGSASAMPLDVASPFLQRSGAFILAILAAAQMLAVLRLLQGPTLADRVIALDFIGITCASMIGVYAIIHGEPLYLRAAIVLSLMGFLGTVGFALYCEKRGVP